MPNPAFLLGKCSVVDATRIQRTIAQARQQLDTIAGEAEEQCRSGFLLTPVATGEGDDWRLVLQVPRPSDAVARLVDEVLLGLRAALDQLACCLVEASSPHSSSAAAAFPLCSSPGDFAAHVLGHGLGVIPPKARAALAGLQPYPDRPQRLAQLRELSDCCRNRRLRVAYSVASDVHFSWRRGGIVLYESTLPAVEAREGRAVAVEASKGLAMPGDLEVRGEARTSLAFVRDPAASLSVWTTLIDLADEVDHRVLPALGKYL